MEEMGKYYNVMLTISKKIDAKVSTSLLNDMLRRRPGVRSVAFGVIERQGLSTRNMKLVADFLTSGVIVDQFAYIDAANALVHARARSRPNVELEVGRIVAHLKSDFFGIYAAIWLMSKYASADSILEYVADVNNFWKSDIWLGRVVGGLVPVMCGGEAESKFQSLIEKSRNIGAIAVAGFHFNLQKDTKAVSSVRKIIAAKNTSKTLGITHAKFLMLLSVLRNGEISNHEKKRLVRTHCDAWKDIFYRDRARMAVGAPALAAIIKP
jgi:hypothetical protein